MGLVYKACAPSCSSNKQVLSNSKRAIFCQAIAHAPLSSLRDLCNLFLLFLFEELLLRLQNSGLEITPITKALLSLARPGRIFPSLFCLLYYSIITQSMTLQIFSFILKGDSVFSYLYCQTLV